MSLRSKRKKTTPIISHTSGNHKIRPLSFNKTVYLKAKANEILFEILGSLNLLKFNIFVRFDFLMGEALNLSFSLTLKTVGVSQVDFYYFKTNQKVHRNLKDLNLNFLKFKGHLII